MRSLRSVIRVVPLAVLQGILVSAPAAEPAMLAHRLPATVHRSDEPDSSGQPVPPAFLRNQARPGTGTSGAGEAQEQREEEATRLFGEQQDFTQGMSRPSRDQQDSVQGKSRPSREQRDSTQRNSRPSGDQQDSTQGMSRPSRDQLQKPDSPVFKRKTTRVPPLLQQSDALYEIWQAFLVSRKANAGDALAQHELGVRYMIGRGIEADTGKAAYWFHQASVNNVLAARFNLAVLLYHGWGISWNPFESFKAFLSCAEAGMNEAQYVVGLYYTENLVVPRDYGRALVWIRKAAAGGYAPAKEALPELEKAAARRQAEDASAADSSAALITVFPAPDDTADQQATQALVASVLVGGDPEMRKALGLSRMLDQDVGVDSLRLQGIAAAAQAGSPEALAVLGRNSEKGIGRSRNVVEACGYYIRALRMDWPRASRLLWVLVNEQGVVGEIKGQARRGDPEAQFVWVALFGLGYESVLYREEAFLTPAQAVQMLRRGTERGHAGSMNELALCHFSGRWVPQDVDEAVRLWTRAGSLGSREAEIRLAVVDVRRSDDSLRVRAAVASLARAAEDGSILAEVALAYCYEHGIGMRPQPGEAVRLYRIAARRGSQDAYRALRRLHDDLRPPEPRFAIEEL